MSDTSITERIRPCELTLKNHLIVGLAQKGEEASVYVWLLVALLPEPLRSEYEGEYALTVRLPENDPAFRWLKIEDPDFSRRLELMKQYAFFKITINEHPYLTDPLIWEVTHKGFIHLQRNFPDLKLEVEYNPQLFTMDDLMPSPVLKILDIPVALMVNQEHPIELGDFYMTDDWQIAERQQQGGAE